MLCAQSVLKLQPQTYLLTILNLEVSQRSAEYARHPAARQERYPSHVMALKHSQTSRQFLCVVTGLYSLKLSPSANDVCTLGTKKQNVLSVGRYRNWGWREPNPDARGC